MRSCFLSSLFAAALVSPLAAAPSPNIVLVLADDLGASDVGCYGADLIETSNIDALTKEGIRFTQAYAMPVCSPTRAALLTGKHAGRLHLTIWSEGSLKGPANRKLLQAESSHDLVHAETTLAKHLQSRGYLTALVGKWHLGDADHYPETHGFDVNIGGTHWGAPTTFFWPYSGSGRFGDQFRFVPHLEFGKEGEYLTDRLTDEAIRVIDHPNGQPFFLYLAHHAPHTPIEAKADDIAYFEKKLKPGMHHQNPVYAAMIKSLDESVGRVRAHLEARGLADNTVFIFTSDNGGYIGTDRKAGQTVPVTSNHPLRSGKGSCYEGGIRIPMIIHWPGLTKPGLCDRPVLITDLFHTFAGQLDLPLPADFPGDGVDLTPVLRDPAAALDRDALFFHYPHYYETTTPVSAVREGDWKLLHYYEDDHVELYHLANDPGEQTDLTATEPGKARALRQRLDQWRAEASVNAPSTNPDWKPKR